MWGEKKRNNIAGRNGSKKRKKTLPPRALTLIKKFGESRDGEGEGN